MKRKIVKTKTTGFKTKETERTRVKESWKVKADKGKAIRKELKRSETEEENKKEIKRRQTKIEKFPALKDFSFHLHLQLHFSFLFHLSISFYHLHFPSSCSFQLSFHLPFSRIHISRFQGW